MDKAFKLFQKLIAAPYLLALLGLLLPLMTVSCSDKVIAEPTFYELANGLDLRTSLQEPAAGYLNKLETGNPKALEKFRENAPDFPKMMDMPQFYGIALALVIAAIFGLMSSVGIFASIGSIFMGLMSLLGLWAIVLQMQQEFASMGMQLLSIKPGTGLYCASILIIIGTAMNIASIVRPAVEKTKAGRAARKDPAQN